MHISNEDISVLVFGNNEFSSTLIELKDELNFSIENFTKERFNNQSIIFYFQEGKKNNSDFELIKFSNNIKILFYQNELKDNKINFDLKILLPSKISFIRSNIFNLMVKKKFLLNSTIQIKNYILDKNEKKLFNGEIFITLTEKEIFILDLLLEKKASVSKEELLSSVWNYAKGVDTHTVETHIYRLRKKINERFNDKNFIKTTSTDTLYEKKK